MFSGLCVIYFGSFFTSNLTKLAFDKALSKGVFFFSILLILTFCSCFGSSGFYLYSISCLISCYESVSFYLGGCNLITYKDCGVSIAKKSWIKAFSSKKRDPSAETIFFEFCLLRPYPYRIKAWPIERSVPLFPAGTSLKLITETIELRTNVSKFEILGLGV